MNATGLGPGPEGMQKGCDFITRKRSRKHAIGRGDVARVGPTQATTGITGD
jgi:hypothetical protein